MLLSTHALVGMALSLPVAVAAPELAPFIFSGTIWIYVGRRETRRHGDT